ncbi:hypothetical protein ACHAXH_006651 [Discostella pseudostelligera]
MMPAHYIRHWCLALLIASRTITSALVITSPFARPISSSIYYDSSPCRHRWYRPPLSASTNSNDNTIDDLPSHYTSQPVLSWLSKMATSYKLERGEDLLDVILRESSSELRTMAPEATTTPLLHLAMACATTNLPIASHDFLRDPNRIAIYNYGNLAFLHGFGYEWEEFIQLPSSKCVETPGEVEERQRLLDAVLLQQANTKVNSDNCDDVASKYDNLIRVRKDGRKILLKGVNLWNIYDDASLDNTEIVRARIKSGELKAIGQAVWIRHVEHLD